jgi:hypothetical protein
MCALKVPIRIWDQVDKYRNTVFGTEGMLTGEGDVWWPRIKQQGLKIKGVWASLI